MKVTKSRKLPKSPARKGPVQPFESPELNAWWAEERRQLEDLLADINAAEAGRQAELEALLAEEDARLEALIAAVLGADPPG